MYDRDGVSDDSLSNTTRYDLDGYISRSYMRKNCDSGYIIFDYHFSQSEFRSGGGGGGGGGGGVTLRVVRGT